MKNKRVFSKVLLAVLVGLCMLGIVGCDNGTTTDTPTPTEQYTVTFDANGGTVSPATETVDEGKTLSSLPKPTKTGENNVFQAWYTKNGTSNNEWGTPFTVLTPITADITVYAKWGSSEPTKYTVTFDLDGGTGAQASTPVNAGDPVGSLPTPTKDNNTFGGWWTEKNGGGTAFKKTTAVTFDITVYAKWVNAASTKYTVTFDPDGGTVTQTNIQVNAGGSLGPSLPVPTRDNYTYEGWFTAKNGEGTSFVAATIVNGNITVYAKWTAIANAQKVISITGLSSYSGDRVRATLTSKETTPIESNGIVSLSPGNQGGVSISNEGSAILPLLLPKESDDEDDQPWTGSGSYYVVVIIRRQSEDKVSFLSKQQYQFNSATTEVKFLESDFTAF
jgi:uncharacterized repeat protein (TIGR02543 family)